MCKVNFNNLEASELDNRLTFDNFKVKSVVRRCLQPVVDYELNKVVTHFLKLYKAAWNAYSNVIDGFDSVDISCMTIFE